MNLQPIAHQKSIETHGKEFGKTILDYLHRHKKKYYKGKHVTQDTHLKQRQTTIGTIWLRDNGYITKFNGKNSPWEYNGRQL